MRTVNVLTEGFRSPNGISFISPLIIFQRYLLGKGINVNFYSNLDKKMENCEVLLIESKFFKKKWKEEINEILRLFKEWRKKKIKLIFCDTTDSSSWIKTEVFDYVDKYAKGQILKNRKKYLRPIYANRVYADFYHQKYKVSDFNPVYSEKLREDQLSKINLSWNSGLSNYSFFGPLFGRFMNFYTAKYLWKFTSNFNSPSVDRSIVNCRFSNNYSSKSVRYQRDLLSKRLASYIATKKVNRFEYYNEMKKSLVSIVPFGYGEITLKDFETFINGSILLKPEMSHMLTWPNFYIENKTYIKFSWRINDLKKQINYIINNPKRFIEVAKEGQNLYKKYTIDKKSPELFYKHLKKLID
tara:strand:+ start:4142 stop:5209 length:1068 start_codon:yes stop_codon:yes gene_type:complete